MSANSVIVTDARAVRPEPGQSVRAWLGVGQSWFGPVRVPIFVARGVAAGPKLVVVAAQHPDEVYGVLGCLDFINDVRAESLRGEVWVLPCLNVIGYVSGGRMSPFDHQDMNRVFPGRPAGTVTEQIAHALVEQVAPGADLILDLHGGSVENGNWAFGRWTDAPGKPSAYPIVRAMDVHFLVGASDTTPGSLGAMTPALGVPQISIEAGWCIRYPRENARQMAGFITTAMLHLGILEGPKPEPKDLTFKKTASVRAHTGGAWKTYVSMGDEVAKGQALGVVMDLLGHVLQTATAPDDGTVCVMRTGVRVHAGESLITLGVSAAPPALPVS